MHAKSTYDHLFKHTIALLCKIEKTGKIIELNPEWEHVLGYKLDELIGSPQFQLIHPDDSEKSKMFLASLESKNEIRGFVNRIKHKNGAYHWFEWSARLVDNIIYTSAYDISNRYNAEKALRSSELKIESIFRVITTGLGAVEDRVLVEINPEICRISGYSREELIGQSSRILYPNEEEFLRVGEAIRKVINEKGPGEIDTIWQRKDGSLKNIHISGTASDPEDPTKGIIFSAIDITDQERAKMELIRNQKFLMESQRIAKMGSFELRLSDRNLYWSRETYLIFGLEPEFEPTLDDFYKLVHQDDIEMVRAHLHETVNNKEFREMECRIITPDGIIKSMLLAGEVVTGADQNVTHIYGIVRDVTEEKERELQIIREKQKAEESEQRFKALHNASFGGIAIHDKGVILDCNQGLSEMTGYSIEELTGMNGLLLVAESSREVVLNNILNDFEEPYEVYGIRKNGEEYPLRIEGRVIPYKGLKVRSTEFRDITAERRTAIELIKAKERAEESDKLKTAFLANLSHEIRTPMNGILGFAELLKNDDLTEEMKRNYINVIEQSGNRMLRLINDLVDISKIEVNQIELKPEITNLNLLMNSVYDFFKLQVEQKGLLFTYRKGLDDKTCRVIIDKLKLEQVLSNLLINAVKFTKAGSIYFDYSLEESWLVFKVKDSGIGIQPGMEKVIFERFMQAENTHLTGIEGTGLGLSISKAFIELMGGTIWVTSIQGEGSEFCFKVPYQIADENTATYTHVSNLDFEEGLTILVAEDDEVSYLYLEQILKNSNFKLLHAKNGLQTLDMLNEHEEISMVLMDLKMPVMNGVDATLEIRKKNRRIPIIAQTAYAYDTDRKKAMEAGCNDFISKPIKKEMLLEKIESLLNK